MQNRQLHRIIYLARHEYLTLNNVVLAIAALIAISWAWSSVEAVQRNYALQRQVDDKRRQQQLMELQTENLQYEQRYFKSHEYQTLEAKRRLGLAEPGEKVLILPANSDAVKAADTADRQASNQLPSEIPPLPPFEQWMEFLFGAKSQN